MIKKLISEKIHEAIKTASEKGELGQLKPEDVQSLPVEKTKNPEFGDYSVNVSPLSRNSRMAPQKTAEAIKPYLYIEDTAISIISGFINFKIGTGLLNEGIAEIIKKNKDFGRNNLGIKKTGEKEKILLEYVSANPTGPLHIGHGRWAAVGSSLAELLKFSGYDVTQEFYINDRGNQIMNLGNSLWIRILQEFKKHDEIEFEAKFPESEEEGAKNYYSGDYLIAVAEKYLKKEFLVKDVAKTGREKALKFYKDYPNLEHLRIYSYWDDFDKSGYGINDEIADFIYEICNFAKDILREQQEELLKRFKTDFDYWFSESLLYENDNKASEAFEKLKSLGNLEEKDGAWWFKSSEYGDEKNRVIQKSDGCSTYLYADIAYHYDKINRGFDRLINIWGADHHGYVARIKASVEAMGKDPACLEVLLGQLVNLIISGGRVRMGKRKKMLTLEELINEVGVDGTRFWMIMRSIDTTLDFDVDLAKSCSEDNPVFYVQYAHARACSILRTATAERLDRETKDRLPPFMTKEELENLTNSAKFDKTLLEFLHKTDDEKEKEATKALVLKLESFEDLVQTAAKLRTPYMIAKYTQELAKDFHKFYTVTRVLSDDRDLMKSRLILVNAVKQVIYNSLNLLGVNAPESM